MSFLLLLVFILLTEKTSLVLSVNLITDQVLEQVINKTIDETKSTCLVIFSEGGLRTQLNTYGLVSTIQFSMGMPLYDLESTIDTCKLFLIHCNNLKDLENIFTVEAFYNFEVDDQFVIILEDSELLPKDPLKIPMLKDSHFLILLKPLASSSLQYAAYRPTLLPSAESFELFNVFGPNSSTARNGSIFNEKLKNFERNTINAVTTPYEPYMSLFLRLIERLFTLVLK